MRIQSLVAPRVLIPVVDSSVKNKPFASIEGVVPRRYLSDDTADTSDDKHDETEEILEDSSVCSL